MEMTPQEVKEIMDLKEPVMLVDVREIAEVEVCSIEGARHIPMQELSDRLDELDPEALIVLYCHHGMRSLQAAEFLRQQGFDNAFSLEGGIDAWAEEIDPEMERY